VSEQKQDEKVGALWSKSSARGEFFTGNIEIKDADILRQLVAAGGKLQVVVFRNDKKTGNQPDWHILKSRPKDASVPDAGHNLNAPPVDAGDIPF
jgi:hypothetical protein